MLDRTLVDWATYIMRGAPHVLTYGDLIVAGAQGEPAACASDQGGRCSGINGEERP